MGVYTGIFIAKDAKIPEEKRPEFEERLETLLRVGGMGNVRYVRMFGKACPLFSPVKMDCSGLRY